MKKKITLEITQENDVISVKMEGSDFSRIEIIGFLSDFLMEYAQKSRKPIETKKDD